MSRRQFATKQTRRLHMETLEDRRMLSASALATTWINPVEPGVPTALAPQPAPLTAAINGDSGASISVVTWPVATTTDQPTTLPQQSLHEDLVALRQDYHAAISGLVADSQAVHGEDRQEYHELRQEAKSEYHEARTELRQEVAAPDSEPVVPYAPEIAALDSKPVVSHAPEVAAPASKPVAPYTQEVATTAKASDAPSQDTGAKTNVTIELRIVIVRHPVAQPVEQTYTVIKHGNISIQVSSEDRVETTPYEAREYETSVVHAKVDEGQFLLRAVDPSTTVQIMPEPKASLPPAQQPPLQSSPATASDRLGSDGLGRAAQEGAGRWLSGFGPFDVAKVNCPTFAVYEEARPADETTILVGFGLTSSEVNVSTSALDEAVRQFIVAADDVAHVFVRGLTSYGMWPWMLTVVAVGVALEMRRRKKATMSAPALCLAADAELTWTPGMPGSLGDDVE